MSKWEPHLHWTFRQEHVLFPSLVLHSFLDFTVAALFVILICLLERLLTLFLEKHCIPRLISRSRWRKALWRSCLYWVAAFLRLCYMLAAMSFQLGIILVIVTSLAFGQFMIECWGSDEAPQSRYDDDDESRISLIQPQRHCYPFNSVASKRQKCPRSRPKPQDISIHPSHSNIARADVAALEMGVSEGAGVCGDTAIQTSPMARTRSDRAAKAPEVLARSHKASLGVMEDDEPFLIGGSNSDND